VIALALLLVAVVALVVFRVPAGCLMAAILPPAIVALLVLMALGQVR